MVDSVKNYFTLIQNTFSNIIATGDSAQAVGLTNAIDLVINMVLDCQKKGKKLMFIGNGASASIASHMSVDSWKNAGVKALSFNDGALLTCIGNDYGYEHTFEKPIEMFAEPGDILFAISSSGKSKNILNGAQKAKALGCSVVTLSGFSENNPLRPLGKINFYVPVSSYGPVEILHHAICHCVVDCVIFRKSEVQK